MVLIQGGHQVSKHLPVRVVLNHADLLADDTPLLVHALLGKPGLGDEGEENAQVFFKFLGGFKVVTGDGAGGKGVGAGPVGGQVLKALPSFLVSNILCSR